ncbi:kinase-like domain-containing protein [Boeremia exigua]|uniref:kinase-like domain-containing protein n=1 Tax=Boeremia exigua TaxID=749465 RepID=UPI001E8D572D|nr:kinase-like domain-containing protein [Boeremia exigua]KAH6625546.1 kinase-like domain-containing protein [Boeremia exigua]
MCLDAFVEGAATSDNKAYQKSPVLRIGIRMASTIVGQSGRVYIQREVLQERKDPRLNIFKAESQDQSFVFKRVSKPFFDLSLRLAAEFPNSRRLRMHVDLNEDENVLIYPYYQHTLLALLQEDSNVSDAARKKILLRTGEAIQDFTARIGFILPDNILVNWTRDEEGTKICETGALIWSTHAVGNAMWRSPEGQTGRGMCKASDIYSFGLVVILLLNDYSYLVEHGIPPEQAVLTRHFAYFGSANEGLLKHVDSDTWSEALKSASQVAEETLQEQPVMSFDVWGHELGTEAQKMIAGMTRIDPRARLTIDQVMAHAWWQEVV